MYGIGTYHFHWCLSKFCCSFNRLLTQLMLRELAVKWLLLPAQESTGMSVMNEIDDTISCLFARAQYGTTYVTSC